jgi:serine/threonine-protein kinase
MAADKKERVEEILETAETVPQAQLLDYVDQASDGDPEITEEVTSLIGSDSHSLDDFLDHGLPRILNSAASDSQSPSGSDASQLKKEEDEEKRLWEGAFVGDAFENNGRYKIDRLRRFGLMASLFFASDRKIGNPVVIKIPRRSAYIKSDEDHHDLKNLNANIRNNFRREFDALRKLERCSYVVHVRDFGDLPDRRPFMVQEFIDGKNALELLNANRNGEGKRVGLSFQEIANIARQVGKGLEAAHELSILHRDIKAENVMVTHDGAVKLIDFNAADVKLPISPMSTVFSDQTWGTLGYVSPEQLTNMMETDQDSSDIQLTPASDVYSLAVTAYQLLTGRMPFSANVRELIQQQATCSFKPASELRAGVTPEIDQLLRNALNPDPSKRPQNAREFSESLAIAVEQIGAIPTESPRPIQQEPPLVSVPRPPVQPNLPKKKKKGATKGIAVAAGVILLVVFGYGLWSISDKGSPNSANSVPATKEAQPAGSGPLRAFSYWLDLTRATNGHPEDRSIRASGQEVFTNGDYFVVNFASPQSGYLYLLNEGRNYEEVTTFYYQGKFSVTANTRVSSSRLGFDNKDGTEKFWFLFSNTPVRILDKYQAPREIPEEESAQVRAYLNQSVPSDLAYKEDISKAQTDVMGSGDTIAYKAELRHRRSE